MGFGGWIGQASQTGSASSPQWTTTHRFVDQDQMGGDDGDQCGAHTFPQQGCNNKFISMIDGRQEFQKYLRVVQNVIILFTNNQFFKYSIKTRILKADHLSNSMYPQQYVILASRTDVPSIYNTHYSVLHFHFLLRLI